MKKSKIVENTQNGQNNLFLRSLLSKRGRIRGRVGYRDSPHLESLYQPVQLSNKSKYCGLDIHVTSCASLFEMSSRARIMGHFFFVFL